MRKEITHTKAQYGFPETAFPLIRDIAAEDILEEIRENAYKVNFSAFCKTFRNTKNMIQEHLPINRYYLTHPFYMVLRSNRAFTQYSHKHT